MRCLRLVGIAILAVAAICAIGASTASATKITYSGNGRFSVTGGQGQLETVGGTDITCNGTVGTGQLGRSVATTASLTVSFRGCALLGKKCTSPGGTSGLIDFFIVLATFGQISTDRDGVLLRPESGTAFLVPVKCGESELALRGSVIGEILSPLDTQLNSFIVSFQLKAGEKGKQEITKFEGEEKTNVLESTIEGVTEVAGLESRWLLDLLEGSGQLLK
jgi:hypothetical protein